MPRDAMLSGLESASGSLIAAETLTQLEGFSSTTLSDADRANFTGLLRLIEAEADAELDYAARVDKGVIESAPLLADLGWLPFGKISTRKSSETDLVEAKTRLEQLTAEVARESGKLEDIPEAGDLIAMVQYFKTSTPSDIAHIRWLIVVLSLLLYLIKAYQVICRNANLLTHHRDAKRRLDYFRPLLVQLFPGLPQPRYSELDNEPPQGQSFTP
ncbi:hypothetical protein [Xanthomonas tesorieronis]|uniref:hypothetical protein n=1 Tax=Xanthomonas tesorieronis TaxID=3160839 RepID=UPI003511485A